MSLAEIKGLSDRVGTKYYTGIPADYATTGQALYNWLDKSDRLLANALREPSREGLVIAIATGKGLANLPWELLHDGKQFLVEKTPPIVPVRWVSNGKPIAIDDHSPQNRPLNVLFMATSPLGVEPELDYEAEEGKILEATKRVPLNLRVEESGCLSELAYVVREYETNYFDIFHLIGHAGHEDESAYFITEDDYSQRVDSSASDIANALRLPLPRLIFLSGCRTGYSSNDAVPSIAEELLNMGATAVVGWGQRVPDTDASVAASQLYGQLSQGGKLTEVIASTYKALIKQNIPDWHKLRLYVGSDLPQELVTPLRTSERKQLYRPSITVEFLDDEKRLRVVSRENFVGRRRQLQNCLRTLKTDNEKVGVLIHGMGGLGKSSIAARIWERLAEHEKILLWRQVDEPSLIRKLKDKLINPQTLELISHLENQQIKLKSRLAYLFSQLAELGEKPFLLILDDFEWNLEPRAGGYILKPEVAPILEALVLAIQEMGTSNRILITSRYDFDSGLLSYFYKQGLDRFNKSVLTKKLNRLKHFNSNDIAESIRKRALNLADGNPRLLEYIDDKILGTPNFETKLTELEHNPALWKEKVIWDELYQLINEPLQNILSHCLVYEISVPMTALEAVCESLPNHKQHLQRGIDLGLIDVSSEYEESNRVYRVLHILSHIIFDIKLPNGAEAYSLYQKAHETLHKLWGTQENKNQEKWQEIFRLKFADKNNPERFREGFHQMLAVQSNPSSDNTFENELKKAADDLVNLDLNTLENYLKQKKWKEADEETAWIFYQIMVKRNYQDWEELMKSFPCETLRKTNQLWLDFSNNQFGMSLQAQIYNEVNGDWSDFGDRVGWRKGGNWKDIKIIYETEVLEVLILNKTPTLVPQLPALIYARTISWIGLWGLWCGEGLSLLAQRLVICSIM